MKKQQSLGSLKIAARWTRHKQKPVGNISPVPTKVILIGLKYGEKLMTFKTLMAGVASATLFAGMVSAAEITVVLHTLMLITSSILTRV